MPMSVREAIDHVELGRGDVAILNDPYAGGTHLPDITMVLPVFSEDQSSPTFYVATRAHHADVGGYYPGSMGPCREIYQSSSDSSKVWGLTLSSIPAGSDASCPNAGAIGCLLLQSIGSADGPTGGKMMTKTTFIQRLNTQGGTAPAAGCSATSDVGKQALIPYSADYFFFRRTIKALNTKSTRYEFL